MSEAKQDDGVLKYRFKTIILTFMAFSYLMPYGLPKWLVIKSTNESMDKKT